MGSEVSVERRGQIAVIAIDNPPVNLLHPKVATQIAEAAADLGGRADVRCLVITGSGRHFVGGGDLRYVRTLDAPAAERYVRGIQEMQLGLARPGPARHRGCQRHRTRGWVRAGHGVRHPRLGRRRLVGPTGGDARDHPRCRRDPEPPRLVGMGRAKWLVYTGKRITARRAFEIGLVDEVVAPELVLGSAVALGQSIAANAPLAVQAAKRAINLGLQMSIEEAHQLEATLFAPLVDTEDFAEGSAAFFRKQQAEFKGK